MGDESRHIELSYSRPDIVKGVNGTKWFTRRLTYLYDLYSFNYFHPDSMNEDDKKYFKLKIDDITKNNLKMFKTILNMQRMIKTNKQTLKHFLDEMNGIKNGVKKL